MNREKKKFKHLLLIEKKITSIQFKKKRSKKGTCKPNREHKRILWIAIVLKYCKNINYCSRQILNYNFKKKKKDHATASKCLRNWPPKKKARKREKSGAGLPLSPASLSFRFSIFLTSFLTKKLKISRLQSIFPLPVFYTSIPTLVQGESKLI